MDLKTSRKNWSFWKHACAQTDWRVCGVKFSQTLILLSLPVIGRLYETYSIPGAAAPPDPRLLFQGLPPPNPRLLFQGLPPPDPRFRFQGLPPPDPRFFSRGCRPPRPRFFPTSRGPWLCVWKLSECHPTRIRVESASVFLHADSDILYTANAPDGILYRHPDSPRAAVMAVSFYSPKICIHTRTMP